MHLLLRQIFRMLHRCAAMVIRAASDVHFEGVIANQRYVCWIWLGLTEIRQPDSTRAECHHAIVLRRDDKYIAQRHHVVMRMFSMSVDPH